MNMDDIPKILQYHTFRVETRDQWGSGVFWKLLNNTHLLAFTCKHNLCLNKPDCKINCGNNCRELVDVDEIRIECNGKLTPITDRKVSKDKDFALLSITLDEAFSNNISRIGVYSIDKVGYRKPAFFRGIPNVLNETSTTYKTHLFDGLITDIDSRDYKLSIKDLSIGEINDVRGVSGSGVFCKGLNNDLGLVGIITNYIGGLSSFVALNPYQVLTTEFGIEIQDFPMQILPDLVRELREASIYEEIETLVDLIKRCNVQMSLSFNPDELKIKREQYMAALEGQYRALNELDN